MVFSSSLVNPLVLHSYPSSFASPSIRSKKVTVLPLCKAGDSDPDLVDRRDLLLKLGGLYSAATLSLNQHVLALPVTTPDITTCRKANFSQLKDPLYGDNCCPPVKDLAVQDYKIPTYSSLRERPAAHVIQPGQLKDYEAAIANSKKIDYFNPWSFFQQAKIHCAYCDGGYEQVGFPDVELQVHASWLFLPFHRWYLYFYERILGKLCGNESFGLPYWNWDNPPGMTMPQIFVNPDSPLYDKDRDQSHLPPVLVDLDNADNSRFTPEEQIKHNLWVMYRAMIANAKTASCFHGAKYVGGSKPNPGAGTIENPPHNLIHRWTGNPKNPNGEHMGSFYSAGLDPIFYCHHANVDRMWSLWQDLGGKDFTDPSWLDTSFLFYDENAKLVRVYVRDCLKTEKLGYTYQKMPILWKDKRARRKQPSTTKPAKREPAKEAKFPLELDTPVKTTLKLPKKTAPDDEYVIVVAIKLDLSEYAKFDVYVNAEDTENLGVTPVEKAGSFVNIPQTARPPRDDDDDDQKPTAYVKLGIGELLEDIGAQKDEEVVVTLVPRKGKVTVVSVKLQTTCDVDLNQVPLV